MYAQDPAAPKRREAVENAEKYLEQALTLDPISIRRHCCTELKTEEGQPCCCRSAIGVDKGAAQPHLQAQLMLASAYLAQQRKDEALAVYREIAKTFSQDPQPLSSRHDAPGARPAGGCSGSVRENPVSIS